MVLCQPSYTLRDIELRIVSDQLSFTITLMRCFPPLLLGNWSSLRPKSSRINVSTSFIFLSNAFIRVRMMVEIAIVFAPYHFEGVLRADFRTKLFLLLSFYVYLL